MEVSDGYHDLLQIESGLKPLKGGLVVQVSLLKKGFNVRK